jgi:myo-inositol 2-dehydrogenase / D-chiro-inositol 1-dehydrogenase
MKKLALIGCGGIGSYHLEHFMKYDDVHLAGFCDIIPERAQVFAHKAGGKAYSSFKKMYDEIQPDMVFICIPPTEHGEIEMETIRRGIHMFVEKPVALDLVLARRIRDSAEAAGIITASGFQCRYSNLVAPTCKFINEHEIVFVECARIGGIPDTNWWKKRSTSGGQIVEQTIHQFDIIRYMMGEPDTVFTMGTKGFVTNVEGYDTEDLTVTSVRFKSGALATISTGCYASTGDAFDSKITFSARNARLDHYILHKANIYAEMPAADEKKSSGLVIMGDGSLGHSEDDAVLNFYDDGGAGTLCDRTFVDAVITGDASRIRSPYSDAVRSLAFTLSCNLSMDSGLPVKVEQ